MTSRSRMANGSHCLQRWNWRRGFQPGITIVLPRTAAFCGVASAYNLSYSRSSTWYIAVNHVVAEP
jgi:hypothetical protein